MPIMQRRIGEMQDDYAGEKDRMGEQNAVNYFT